MLLDGKEDLFLNIWDLSSGCWVKWGSHQGTKYQVIMNESQSQTIAYFFQSNSILSLPASLLPFSPVSFIWLETPGKMYYVNIDDLVLFVFWVGIGTKSLAFELQFQEDLGEKQLL